MNAGVTPQDRHNWRAVLSSVVNPTTGVEGRKRAINRAVLPLVVAATMAAGATVEGKHYRGPAYGCRFRGQQLGSFILQETTFVELRFGVPADLVQDLHGFQRILADRGFHLTA